MQTDVLIVGGGLSGLALADRLARDGTGFLLAEAQDRLGGRILTRTVAGGAFDLGPAWFWPGQPRMAALARRFAIPVFEQAFSGDLVFQDRTGAVHRGRGHGAMQGSYRLDGGMGALVDALAGELDREQVMTGTRLETVHHAPDGVTAHLLRDGMPLTVRARRIVLALPPRVIAETLRFEPDLDPAARQALWTIPTWMAGQAKILAVYDEPHWRNAGLSGDAMSQSGPMVEIHDASPMDGGPYALFGFVGLPADIRDAQGDDLTQLALRQLIALFGSAMATPRALILQDWARIPEIARPADRRPLGHHPAYGLPAGVGALAASGIHFAATETARGAGGYLEGALEAAEAAAIACSSPSPA
jgi:monoamine oxidase